MPTTRVAGAMPAHVALARATATRALRELGGYDANLTRRSRHNQLVLARAMSSINDAILAATIAGKSSTVDQLTRAVEQLNNRFGLRYARDMIRHGIALLHT